MKAGSGCRIGSIAASRVVVTVTAAGPTVDAQYQLIDPKSGSIVAVSRKTRDWSPEVKEALEQFLDAIESGIAEKVFETSEGYAGMSIAEHLNQVAEKEEEGQKDESSGD